MDKATFIAIVEEIVSGFEDDDFKGKFAQAQASGDVQQMMSLPLAVQNAAFAAHGCPDSATFKAAGKEHGTDSQVGELLVRMKAALR